MYQLKTLQPALVGLIGFRGVNVAAELAQSRSGLFVDSVNSLLTSDVLTGVAKPANVQLSDLIKTAISDSIGEVLTAVRTRKLARLESRSALVANKALYDGEGALLDRITPAGRFVGLRLRLTSLENVTFSINRIGVQLSDVLEGLNVYIYSESGAERFVTLTANTRNRMSFSDVQVSLTPGQSYIVGYYENDLAGVRAIRRNRTIDMDICAGCSPNDARLREGWKPYTGVTAVRIDSNQFNDEGKVDADSVAVDIAEQNWGINLVLSVNCDITDLLIGQQALLAPAINQQAAAKLLNAIAYSTKTTGLEQATRDKAVYALKNDVLPKLEKLLDAVDIELTGLDPRCLPEKTVTEPQYAVRKTNMFAGSPDRRY